MNRSVDRSFSWGGAAGLTVGLSFLGFTTSLDATTIVMLTTSDRVVVAADSRQQLVQVRDGRLMSHSVVDSACKVRLGNAAAVAAWDVVSEQRDNGTGYDALQVAREFLDAPDTIPEKLDNFFHAFMKDNSTRLSAGEARPEQPVGVVFVGWAQGAVSRAWAVLSRPAYTPPPTLLPSWSTAVLPGSSIPRLGGVSLDGPTLDFHLSDLRVCSADRCPAARVFGRTDGIDTDRLEQLLKQRPSEREMISLARSAVESATRAAPDFVGGPIDVLVIDKKGPRWVTVKAECADNDRRR